MAGNADNAVEEDAEIFLTHLRVNEESRKKLVKYAVTLYPYMC